MKYKRSKTSDFRKEEKGCIYLSGLGPSGSSVAGKLMEMSAEMSAKMLTEMLALWLSGSSVWPCGVGSFRNQRKCLRTESLNYIKCSSEEVQTKNIKVNIKVWTCFCCSRLKGRKLTQHSLKGSKVVGQTVSGSSVVLGNIDKGQAELPEAMIYIIKKALACGLHLKGMVQKNVIEGSQTHIRAK